MKKELSGLNTEKSANVDKINYSIRDFYCHSKKETYVIPYVEVSDIKDPELQWSINRTLFEQATWIFKYAEMDDSAYDIFKYDMSIDGVFVFCDYLSVSYSSEPVYTNGDTVRYSIVVDLTNGEWRVLTDFIENEDQFIRFIEDYYAEKDMEFCADPDRIQEYGSLTAVQMFEKNYSENNQLDGKPGVSWMTRNLSYYLTDDGLVIKSDSYVPYETLFTWDAVGRYINLDHRSIPGRDADWKDDKEIAVSCNDTVIDYTENQFYFRTNTYTYCIPYIRVTNVVNKELQWKINRVLFENACWMLGSAQIGQPIYDIYKYETWILKTTQYKEYLSVLYCWREPGNENDLWVDSIVVNLSTGERLMLADILKDADAFADFMQTGNCPIRDVEDKGSLISVYGIDRFEALDNEYICGEVTKEEIQRIVENGGLSENEVLGKHMKSKTGIITDMSILDGFTSFILSDAGVTIFPTSNIKDCIFYKWDDVGDVISLQQGK